MEAEGGKEPSWLPSVSQLPTRRGTAALQTQMNKIKITEAKLCLQNCDETANEPE